MDISFRFFEECGNCVQDYSDMVPIELNQQAQQQHFQAHMDNDYQRGPQQPPPLRRQVLVQNHPQLQPRTQPVFKRQQQPNQQFVNVEKPRQQLRPVVIVNDRSTSSSQQPLQSFSNQQNAGGDSYYQPAQQSNQINDSYPIRRYPQQTLAQPRQGHDHQPQQKGMVDPNQQHSVRQIQQQPLERQQQNQRRNENNQYSKQQHPQQRNGTGENQNRQNGVNRNRVNDGARHTQNHTKQSSVGNRNSQLSKPPQPLSWDSYRPKQRHGGNQSASKLGGNNTSDR